MRALCVAICALTFGCATTVQRLDGELPTPLGAAQNDCEQQDWLVPAPTRAEFGKPGRKRTVTRDDGIGLYRVGSSDPESIPALSAEFPDSDMVRRHREAVRRHDNEKILAAGLGAAGIVAMTVGTVLFVSSFESKRKSGEESQEINSGRAITGGAVFAGGFGLGIAGIIVNPNQAERSRADAARHVFLQPDDDFKEVESLVDEHNGRVRRRCSR